MLVCLDPNTAEGCGTFNRDPAKFCHHCGISLSFAHRIEQTVLHGKQGSYELIQGIGCGGFGAVYKAKNTELQGRLVAIKESFRSDNVLAFQNEFEVLQELKHPNLPRYYEMFEANGRGYLVMEFVPGQSLLDILKNQWNSLHQYYETGLQGLLKHLKQLDQEYRERKEAGYPDYDLCCFLKQELIENMTRSWFEGNNHDRQIDRAKILAQLDKIAYSELGLPFEELCQRSTSKPEPIPGAVLSYLVQLCDVLGFLHQQDMPIIHRDIKPANIRLTPEGLIKLVDFGLFKRGMPQDATVNGGYTKQYAAPEQVMREGGTGPYSDVYSTGATFYHLLTWQAPPPTYRRLIKPPQLLQIPRSLNRNISPSISATISKAMGIEKDCRFSDIGELKHALFCRRCPTPISPDNVKQILEIDQLKRPGASKVAWSPDSHTLAIASRVKMHPHETSGILLWNTQTDECRFFQSPDHSCFAEAISGLAFAPNGQTLVSASDDGTVRLWQVSDGELLWSRHEQEDAARDVVFAPNGQILASASDDGTVRLWRMSDGELLRTLQVHETLEDSQAKVSSIAFAPDGQTLASASWDMSIKLWQVSDGQLINTLWEHEGAVWDVAFAPDGQTLASASQDDTIKLWRVSDGEVLKTLEGHESDVEGLAFAPDGQIIISASYDQTLKLWRPHRTRELHTLHGHTAKVRDVVFAPSGHCFASIGDDSTVRLWGVW